MIAAMPCSRIPKCMYRLSYSPGAKFFHVFTAVPFDGVRSADPPISSGSTPTSALSTVFDAARLATEPLSFVNDGIAFSHPSGSRPSNRRSSSFASAPKAWQYAFHRFVHSACCAAPRARVSRQCASASSGT